MPLLKHCGSGMVSKSTGRRRGRPDWDWRTWAPRYAIALSDGFQAMGLSERAAVDLAVALFYGTEIESAKPGYITYQLRVNPSAATIAGRASTIRQKANRVPIPVGFANWRITMAKAFLIALNASGDISRAGLHILALAREADRFRDNMGDPFADLDFTMRSIVPLLFTKIQMPEFST